MMSTIRGMSLAVIISAIGISMAKDLYGNQVGNVIKGQVCNPVTNKFINMDTINLAIVPFPIVVAEGNITAIGFTVDVLKDIAKGARFVVIVESEYGFIPCTTFGIVRIGSCVYDLEDLIKFLGKVFNIDCDRNLPGYGCKFPLSPGHYHVDHLLRLPKNIPNIVKEYLHGKIDIHLSLIADGSELRLPVLTPRSNSLVR